MTKSPQFNKYVNYKQIAGLVAIVLGIALLIFAIYQKNRVSGARGDINNISKFFSKNPITEYGEGAVHKKLDEYDTQIMWCFVGSAILIIGGIGATFYYRKK